jgi:hypothetical protein
MTPASSVQQRWSLDSIDWRAIRGDAVTKSEVLFYLVAAASFIESTTDRYTQNLIDQFFGDDEITSWLERHWLVEEIQHGHALRRYVQIAGQISSGIASTSRSWGNFQPIARLTDWSRRAPARWPRAASSRWVSRASTPP